MSEQIGLQRADWQPPNQRGVSDDQLNGWLYALALGGSILAILTGVAPFVYTLFQQ